LDDRERTRFSNSGALSLTSMTLMLMVMGTDERAGDVFRSRASICNVVRTLL